MNELTIGLLGALLATNQPQAVSNVIQQQAGVTVSVPDASDPTERELRSVMMADDTTLDEINSWINTNSIPRTNLTELAEFDRKIRARLEVQKVSYERFLRNHPDSAKGYLAYGSFLTDIGDEEYAKVQYLNAKQLDPKNPAVWNQLANYYGHNGELTNAFVHYTEAIRLEPTEPVYYQNFATTVYLYRKDAREFYHINEQQVFDKALGLYLQAMKFDPDNFVLATDYAISYYGIKPFRTNDALVAWTNVLKIAHDENERESVQLHLARTKIAVGEYEQASNHLAVVTNAVFQDLRKRLYRSLLDHKNPIAEEAGEVSTTPTNVVEKISAPATNSPVATNNPGGENSPASTNVPALSTNMLAVPPPSREQKP
jgi:cytochrome c-type biogenesis protein CcmH/NrfG